MDEQVNEGSVPVVDGLKMVKVSAPSAGKKIEFMLDFGKDLNESLELYGEEVVHNRAVRSIKIEAQAAARSMLQAGKQEDDVVAYMQDTWKPGEGTDSQTSLINKFGSWSPEEQQAFLSQLQEKAQG